MYNGIYFFGEKIVIEFSFLKAWHLRKLQQIYIFKVAINMYLESI